MDRKVLRKVKKYHARAGEILEEAVLTSDIQRLSAALDAALHQNGEAVRGASLHFRLVKDLSFITDRFLKFGLSSPLFFSGMFLYSSNRIDITGFSSLFRWECQRGPLGGVAGAPYHRKMSKFIVRVS